MNPLQKLSDFGQAPWLDDIRRSLIESGDLDKLIEEDGLRGITSNPSIFEKAIADSDEYDGAIRELAQNGKETQEIYFELATDDIRAAADRFRPLYDEHNGERGFVSLEVSPHLANDTQGTVEEGRKLWKMLDRPNVFIKVPGTQAGLAAFTQLISEGISVNVTLLFGLPRYREVTEAYMKGLEKRFESGESVEGIASVASFFLSRIDVLVDEKLDQIADASPEDADTAKALRGEVAVASAKQAYGIYKEVFEGERFQPLAEKGAKPQRLLWASTSTKDPSFSDVKYVEALIGPETVNTMPMDTLEAYRDHGQPEARLEDGADEARKTLDKLADLGIDIDEVTQQLEDEAVQKFVKPFDSLMETLESKRSEVLETA